ncbi:MAG: cyclic nucleotide-binding domain-containing protein [Anaerolineae bacterium]|nr:cyclic nucleotide-binding domain-containing protein [Anaerolineae bacterium]
MDLVQILRGVDLFQGLNPEQLRRLADISHRAVYRSDDVIFSQGSVGDKLYIIADGQVEIRFSDADGSDHAVLFLGSGQIFGEMALLDQGKRSATVAAVQDNTIVYGMARDEFEALCLADTSIGYVMMRNMALDLSFKLRHKNLDPSTDL